MIERLAIIAGMGALPRHLADSLQGAGAAPLLCGIEGFPAEGLELDLTFRVERLALFLRALAEADVTQVIFAGAIQRPRLDPAQFDPETAALVPKLLPALQGGDDALLRGVIGLFEDAGFAVVGVADVAPDLVPGAGVLTAHAPTKADEADAARAVEIVAALGAVDVGQGAVVAQGQCLATEALPGTDAMLGFVAHYAARLRPNPQ
ncbi:LpxI family protein, partial [Thioclava sp. BHET1]